MAETMLHLVVSRLNIQLQQTEQKITGKEKTKQKPTTLRQTLKYNIYIVSCKNTGFHAASATAANKTIRLAAKSILQQDARKVVKHTDEHFLDKCINWQSADN